VSVQEVSLSSRSTDAFRDVLEREDHERLDAALTRLHDLLAGRSLWHVNSTESGGGVAEMLSSLLPYAAGAGVDVHWLVVSGGDGFFDITKRVHNFLHENEGDKGPLGAHERAVYDASLDEERQAITAVIQPGDVAVLHDPQTAGLIRTLRDHEVTVIWRCHVGVDQPGPLARAAWRFLSDDVQAANASVFSRDSYVWDGVDRSRTAIIAPCIDVVSPKNHPLEPAATAAILGTAGLVAVERAERTTPEFVRTDGTRDKVQRQASMVEEQPTPVDAPLVLQVSRWDRLKDPVGIIDGFVKHIASDDDRAHLMLAGPEIDDSVADDPESAEAFNEVKDRWKRLKDSVRARVHLACLPMDDDDENSAMVNALQRRADVVVQKSLAEGFGLTVAEAMWKDRPVVASRVGGIQDQIVHRESGILLEDPTDLAEFGKVIVELLKDPDLARSLGAAARERVCDCFLPSHHFEHECDVVESVLG
jgi:trehalose synthase